MQEMLSNSSAIIQFSFFCNRLLERESHCFTVMEDFSDPSRVLGIIYDTKKLPDFYTYVGLAASFRQFQGKFFSSGDLNDPSNRKEWSPIINFEVPHKDKGAREHDAGRYSSSVMSLMAGE